MKIIIFNILSSNFTYINKTFNLILIKVINLLSTAPHY